MSDYQVLSALILSTAADNEAERATSALEDYGPPAAADGAELAKLLAHQQADVVYWAATLLGRLGEQAAPFTAQLAQALESASGLHARQRAAWALGKIGPGAKAALPQLTEAATAKEPRLAKLASQAVDSINK